MTESTSDNSLTTYQRFVGWSRFLVFLIGVMTITQSAVQVYEHWQPNQSNAFWHGLVSFLHYFWPRLLIGTFIGSMMLGLAMAFKQRPPWQDEDS